MQRDWLALSSRSHISDDTQRGYLCPTQIPTHHFRVFSPFRQLPTGARARVSWFITCARYTFLIHTQRLCNAWRHIIAMFLKFFSWAQFRMPYHQSMCAKGRCRR